MTDTLTQPSEHSNDTAEEFLSLGQENLDALAAEIERVQVSGVSHEEAVAMLSAPILRLKANASLFGYTLIGRLVNVMLSFLDEIQMVDEDVISIARANHKTLSVIVLKGMDGDGGEFGQQMINELEGVCRRYHAKRA